MQPEDLIHPEYNDEYMTMVRQRLEEDELARGERERRRRKVLLQQLKAHERQEVGVFLLKNSI